MIVSFKYDFDIQNMVVSFKNVIVRSRNRFFVERYAFPKIMIDLLNLGRVYPVHEHHGAENEIVKRLTR